MLAKLNKKMPHLKISPYPIQWYPYSRSCVKTLGKRVKPQQMPPLMVRKAEWRR